MRSATSRPNTGEAERVIQFVQRFTTLGGSFIGQPFTLLDFQKELIEDIYRPSEDGGRLRRSYLLGIPRKNGKSTLAAALALYHLFADPYDPSPQVISAAGDRAQAKIVFNEAKRMVLSSPALSRHAAVHRDQITNTKNGGTYRAVSADAYLQHGLNPSFVVFDELHVFKNDELIDALTTGSGMRRSPLFLYVSTAGHNLNTPLGKRYVYGRKVESGEVTDPSFGFTWFGPRDTEDVNHSEKATWERFNPAFSLMNLKDFESALLSTPQNSFIRYRLNGWTATASSWLPFGAWQKCQTEAEPLKPGDRVILGFDGAWIGDCTALVACRIEDKRIFFLRLWESPDDDPQWRTPVEEVKDAFRLACAAYDVQQIICDPARFQQTLAELSDEGLPIVEFPTNSVTRMVRATQGFYEAVMNQELSHDGNASLTRHVENCVLREDARGARITKDRKNSKKHIDLAVAAVIAHWQATEWEAPPPPPDYSSLLDWMNQ